MNPPYIKPAVRVDGGMGSEAKTFRSVIRVKNNSFPLLMNQTQHAGQFEKFIAPPHVEVSFSISEFRQMSA
jgi:hypothetical protein